MPDRAPTRAGICPERGIERVVGRTIPCHRGISRARSKAEEGCPQEEVPPHAALPKNLAQFVATYFAIPHVKSYTLTDCNGTDTECW